MLPMGAVTTLRSPRTTGRRDFNDDLSGSPDFFRIIAPTVTDAALEGRASELTDVTKGDIPGLGLGARIGILAREVFS